jgi:hypothetical protein
LLLLGRRKPFSNAEWTSLKLIFVVSAKEDLLAIAATPSFLPVGMIVAVEFFAMLTRLLFYSLEVECHSSVIVARPYDAKTTLALHTVQMNKRNPKQQN